MWCLIFQVYCSGLPCLNVKSVKSLSLWAFCGLVGQWDGVRPSEVTAGKPLMLMLSTGPEQGDPPLLSQEIQWILRLLFSCYSSSWFVEFNYLSPIKSFQLSLDHLSAVVVYHARLSAQTLFLEIGCYYL